MERARFYAAQPVDVNDSLADEIIRQVSARGAATDRIDREAAFAEVCRATIRHGETLVAAGSLPAFAYIPMGPGLVVHPGGGDGPSPLSPWVAVGTTCVIRRAERNADIVAEQQVDVIMIPGERYATTWVRPLKPSELRRASAAPVGVGMSLTTIERVVALQRVGLFADVPGRTLAAVAQRAIEVEVPAGTTVIAEGALDDHMFAWSRAGGSGSIRVSRRSLSWTPARRSASWPRWFPSRARRRVTVLEPAMLLRIEKAVLDELLLDRPELATGIISALVTMLRARYRAGADSKPA